MKRLIEIIIFAVLGFTLSTAGVTAKSWQFWAVMVCAIALSLMEIIAKEVEA